MLHKQQPSLLARFCLWLCCDFWTVVKATVTKFIESFHQGPESFLLVLCCVIKGSTETVQVEVQPSSQSTVLDRGWGGGTMSQLFQLLCHSFPNSGWKQLGDAGVFLLLPNAEAGMWFFPKNTVRMNSCLLQAFCISWCYCLSQYLYNCFCRNLLHPNLSRNQGKHLLR